jgi:hypothetical protein
MALIDRYVGTCPVCEGTFKVHGSAMVLHGYERPGIGYIEGKCPGVDQPAYQISTQGCERYQSIMQGIADRTENRLHHIETHDDPISREERRQVPGKPWETENVKVTYRLGDAKYDHAKRMLVAQVQSELRHATDEVKRMQRLIKNWTLLPLPTIKEDEERAERATHEKRSAKLAEREAKEAAKRERAAKAAAGLAAAEQKARVRRARMQAELDAAMLLMTPDVIGALADRKRSAYSSQTALEVIEQMLTHWVDRDGLGNSTVGDWKYWADRPRVAANAIRDAVAAVRAGTPPPEYAATYDSPW